MTLRSGPIVYGAATRTLLWIGGMVVVSVASITMMPRLVTGQTDLGPGETFRDPCSVCPELVVIPAGSFMMGSPESELYRFNNEGPQHEVTIHRDFALGRYEVTREEFGAFVRSTGLDWPEPDYPQTDRDPAVNVSWNWANQYVEWLSENTGHTYRLPSEAEWEYALRAGTTSATPWGGDGGAPCGYANVYGSGYGGCDDGNPETTPVGEFRPNEFGLYDMSGNVWEWVEDCWHGSYSGAPSDGSAWTTEECADERVMRGGSGFLDPWDGRSAFRIGRRTTEDHRHLSRFGFRVARTLQ